MPPSLFFLFLSLSLLAHGMRQTDVAVRCAAHPAFRPSLTHVLVSSWTYDLSSPDKEQLAYLPRYTGHRYAPVGNPASSMFRGLDLFHTANFVSATSFRMNFQRAATVYMLVDVPNDMFDASKNPTLRGWNTVGWVKREDGPNTISYGVHVTIQKSMTTYAYVFSKKTGNTDFVDLPQTDFIKTRIMGGLGVRGSFNLLIAEEDGSPSPPVGTLNGLVIRPNTVCPAALHDTWRVRDDNTNDPDTRGVTFSSWHPQWDPCFWCAYDHEHGSSPKHIMGYTPKYTYTAWKNNRQQEGDNGFKGYVLRTGDYFFYYGIHVTQSGSRRFGVRFHTINIAVTNRRTGELLIDLQHKGDFGFAAVRLLGGKQFRPIFQKDRDIEEELRANNKTNNFRAFNILDVDNPNPEFQIRNPILIGQYEIWQTLPMCSKAKNRNNILNAQFKLPNTGFKSLAQPDVITDLGRTIRGRFFKSVGLNRSVKAQKMEIASEYCPGGRSGTFYTDPDGKNIRNGPGPNNVRQFIKPGFKFVLNGRYEPVDKWVGLHLRGSRGFFADHGYGINPNAN